MIPEYPYSFSSIPAYISHNDDPRKPDIPVHGEIILVTTKYILLFEMYTTFDVYLFCV